MRRWTPVVIACALTLLCVLGACQASGGLFTPDADGKTQAGELAQQAANATGNPLLMLGVGAANAVIAAFLAKKAAKDKDAEEATPADAESMAAALRLAGYKVERAS